MGIVEAPRIMELAIHDSFTKPSKKAWKKTKEFIKEHKRPIIIGLLVVSIVVIALTIAPEITPLIAALFPASEDAKQKPEEETATLNSISYTEDDFLEDYIELVQESLVANGIDQFQFDESSHASVLDTMKYLGSKISHDLIDAIDDNLSQFRQIPKLQEKLYEVFPSYFNQPDTEESLFSSGTKNAIAYLHQRTDSAFNTCLAERYSQEAEAFRESCGIKKYEGYVPLPGNPLGKTEPIKNILKRFTKNTYRKNLQKADPHPDYASVHAHHVFLQKEVLQKKFNQYGINIHDPQYLVWWEKNEHIFNKDIYNKRWEEFFRRPDLTKDKILEFGKEIMAEYGIEVLY